MFKVSILAGQNALKNAGLVRHVMKMSSGEFLKNVGMVRDSSGD